MLYPKHNITSGDLLSPKERLLMNRNALTCNRERREYKLRIPRDFVFKPSMNGLQCKSIQNPDTGSIFHFML